MGYYQDLNDEDLLRGYVTSDPSSSSLYSDEVNQSFLEGAVRSVSGGAKDLVSNIGTFGQALVGNEEVVRESILAPTAEKGKKQEDFESALSLAKQAYDTGDDSIWSAIKIAMSAASDQPLGALQFVGSQLPNTGVILAGAGAGAKAGGLVTMGNPVGILGGAAIGMLLGNMAVEGGGVAKEEVVKGTFSPSETLEQTLKKSAVVTGVDLLTLGTTGGLGKIITGAPLKAASKASSRILAEAGVDIADKAAVKSLLEMQPDLVKKIMLESSEAAVSAMPTKLQSAGATALKVMNESLGEGVGEYGGSKFAGLDTSYLDAVLESFSSMPTSAVEIAATTKYLKRNQTANILDNPDFILNKYGIDKAGGIDPTLLGTTEPALASIQDYDSFLSDFEWEVFSKDAEEYKKASNLPAEPITVGSRQEDIDKFTTAYNEYQPLTPELTEVSKLTDSLQTEVNEAAQEATVASIMDAVGMEYQSRIYNQMKNDPKVQAEQRDERSIRAESQRRADLYRQKAEDRFNFFYDSGYDPKTALGSVYADINEQEASGFVEERAETQAEDTKYDEAISLSEALGVGREQVDLLAGEDRSTSPDVVTRQVVQDALKQVDVITALRSRAEQNVSSGKFDEAAIKEQKIIELQQLVKKNVDTVNEIGNKSAIRELGKYRKRIDQALKVATQPITPTTKEGVKSIDRQLDVPIIDETTEVIDGKEVPVTKLAELTEEQQASLDASREKQGPVTVAISELKDYENLEALPTVEPVPSTIAKARKEAASTIEGPEWASELLRAAVNGNVAKFAENLDRAVRTDSERRKVKNAILAKARTLAKKYGFVEALEQTAKKIDALKLSPNQWENIEGISTLSIGKHRFVVVDSTGKQRGTSKQVIQQDTEAKTSKIVAENITTEEAKKLVTSLVADIKKTEKIGIATGRKDAIGKTEIAKQLAEVGTKVAAQATEVVEEKPKEKVTITRKKSGEEKRTVNIVNEEAVDLYSSLPVDPTSREKEFHKVLGDSKTLHNPLQWIAARSDNTFFKFLSRRLMEVVGDTPIYSISSEKQYADGIPTTILNSRGVYSYRISTNDEITESAIYVRDNTFSNNGWNETTILHEALHAATTRRMIAGVGATGTKLHKDIGELYQLQQHVKDIIKTRIKDGTATEFEQNKITKFALTDLFEFVTYGFTNTTFMQILEDINYKSKVTAWSKFVQTIKDILGISNVSALSELIRLTDTIITNDEVIQETYSAATNYKKELPLTEIAVLNSSTIVSDTELSDRDLEVLKNLGLNENTISMSMKRFLKGSGHIMRNLVSSVITEIERIAPAISPMLNKMEVQINLKGKKYKDSVTPFLRGYMTLSKENKALVDYHWNNENWDGIKRVMSSSGLKVDTLLEGITEMLDTVRDEAMETGLIYKAWENYLPRQIKDLDSFMQHIHDVEMGKVSEEEKKTWSPAIQAMKDHQRSVGGRELTRAEKIQAVHDLLKTGPSNLLRRPGATKLRTITQVTPGMNQYFMTVPEVLAGHIDNMTERIEIAKVLGETPIKNQMKQLRDLSKSVESLQKQIDESDGEKKAKYIIKKEDLLAEWDRISDAVDTSEEALDSSIAAVVEDSVPVDKQHRVKELLSARFKQRGPQKEVSDVRNIIFMATLGSFNSALTQLGDQAMNIKRFGFGAFPAMMESLGVLWNQRGYVHEQFEMTRAQQDFPTGRTSAMLDTVFKYTGMKGFDYWGKETTIRGFINKYGQIARGQDKAKAWEKFAQKWETPLGTEWAKEAFEALRKGDTKHEQVLGMAFVGLSEFQPVHLSKMPVGYLMGGNLRTAYMLKTFSISALNGIYHDAWIHWKKGDKITAMYQVISMMMLMALAGAGADELKDILAGKDNPISDHVAQNLVSITLLNKYGIEKGLQSDKLATNIIHGLMPPVGIADNLLADLTAVLMDDKEFKGKTLINLPFLGTVAYARSGAGRESYLGMRKSDIQKKFNRGEKVFDEVVIYNKMAREEGLTDKLLSVSKLVENKKRTEKKKKEKE